MRISNRVCGFALLLLSLPAIGAAAGPAHLVRDLKTGSDPFDPNYGADFNSYLAVNGRVVFFGFLQPLSDCGLWVAGADGGEERLADLCGGRTIDSNSHLRMDATAGSVAWFEDLSGVLWRTDGTGAGTFALTVRVAGSSSTPRRSSGRTGGRSSSAAAPPLPATRTMRALAQRRNARGHAADPRPQPGLRQLATQGLRGAARPGPLHRQRRALVDRRHRGGHEGAVPASRSVHRQHPRPWGRRLHPRRR